MSIVYTYTYPFNTHHLTSFNQVSELHAKKFKQEYAYMGMSVNSSGARGQNVGLHINSEGKCLDEALVDACILLWSHLGITGDVRLDEVKAQEFTDKKESSRIRYASKFVQEFKEIKAFFSNIFDEQGLKNVSQFLDVHNQKKNGFLGRGNKAEVLAFRLRKDLKKKEFTVVPQTAPVVKPQRAQTTKIVQATPKAKIAPHLQKRLAQKAESEVEEKRIRKTLVDAEETSIVDRLKARKKVGKKTKDSPDQNMMQKVRDAADQAAGLMKGREGVLRGMEGREGVLRGMEGGESVLEGEERTEEVVEDVDLCEACHKPCLSKDYSISKFGKKWHMEDCFSCAREGCHVGSFTKLCRYYEEAALLLCGDGECKRLFLKESTRCPACMKEFKQSEEALLACGYSWHDECFSCISCDAHLGDQEFYTDSKNQPYCWECYKLEFRTCFECQKPVKDADKIVEACGVTYHVECFACYTCHVHLEEDYFVGQSEGVDKGVEHPFCLQHYLQVIQPPCAKCKVHFDDQSNSNSWVCWGFVLCLLVFILTCYHYFSIQ